MRDFVATYAYKLLVYNQQLLTYNREQQLVHKKLRALHKFRLPRSPSRANVFKYHFLSSKTPENTMTLNLINLQGLTGEPAAVLWLYLDGNLVYKSRVLA